MTPLSSSTLNKWLKPGRARLVGKGPGWYVHAYAHVMLEAASELAASKAHFAALACAELAVSDAESNLASGVASSDKELRLARERLEQARASCESLPESAKDAEARELLLELRNDFVRATEDLQPRSRVVAAAALARGLRVVALAVIVGFGVWLIQQVRAFGGSQDQALP